MRPAKSTAAMIGATAIAATTVAILIENRFRAMKQLLGSILKIERAQLEILTEEAGPDPTGPNPVLRVVK